MGGGFESGFERNDYTGFYSAIRPGLEKYCPVGHLCMDFHAEVPFSHELLHEVMQRLSQLRVVIYQARFLLSFTLYVSLSTSLSSFLYFLTSTAMTNTKILDRSFVS